MERLLLSRPWVYRRGIFLPVSCALLAFVAWADIATGEAVSFRLFYMAPVLLALWFAGRGAGLALTALCGVWFFFLDFVLVPAPHDWLLLFNAVLGIVFFCALGVLAAELKRALERANHLAATDPLTKILNRRSFFEALEREMEAARLEGRPFTAAYIDVDNFKAVNDEFGHTAGDRILMTLAHVLCQNVRGSDTAARLGGDEFAVLLRGADEKEAMPVVERLQERLRAAMRERRWPVTVSIGVGTFHHPQVSVDEVIRLPDRLMLQAKRLGRDRITASADSKPAPEESMLKTMPQQR